MGLTSFLLLCCASWAENPAAARSGASAVAAEHGGAASEPRLAQLAKAPKQDRYGRNGGESAPTPAAAEPLDTERGEDAEEAREIGAAGGPNFLGEAAKKPAPKKPSSPSRDAGLPGETPLKRAADAELSPLAPVQSPPVRAGEADALVRALASAEGLALPGVATPLVQLMSRSVDRRQQIEVTQSYWKLSAAVAEYRIAADGFHRLQQLAPPADGAGQANVDPLVDARLSAGEARLREAEAEVLTNQYALADASRWPVGGDLPLPSDAPLTAAYNTLFDNIYKNVPPPPRAVLLNRALPLRHRSIEMRAAAVAAASHAAEGDFDAYAEGKVDLTIVLESIGELARQQRAFVVALRDYNCDIAEYALSIAPPGLANEKLVGMLLGPSGSAPSNGRGEASPAEGAEGVRRAGFDQPLRTRIRSSGPGAESKTSPFGAAPRRAEPQGAEPQLADEQPDARELNSAEKAAAGGGAADEPAAEPMPVDPPNVPLGPGGEPAKPVSPSEKRPGGKRGPARSDPFSARKPPLGSPDVAAAEAPTGLYPALVDLKPPHRTQELGSALHWAHQLPAGSGEPATLADCLSWTAADPRAMVEAYWQACHWAARYHALVQQAEQFSALDPAALQWRSHVDGAEAMLRLKAAQLAAQADQIEAELDLRVGQFRLAQLAGRPLDGLWPLPNTAPHSGRFLLKLDKQPESVQRMPAVQRLAAVTSSLYEALEQEAAAVVKADLLRADAVARFEQGATTLNEPLDAIRMQLNETLAFLRLQAEYNLHYADYVLTVVPPGADRQVLANALALRQQGG